MRITAVLGFQQTMTSNSLLFDFTKNLGAKSTVIAFGSKYNLIVFCLFRSSQYFVSGLLLRNIESNRS